MTVINRPVYFRKKYIYPSNTLNRPVMGIKDPQIF